MKVLVVVPHFFPRVGGVEHYALNICRELQARGWDVVVVTSGASARVDDLDGMTVYRLRASLTVSNTPLGLRWRRELKRILAAERPDLVNGHTPVPYLADLAERVSGPVPYVLTYHNDLEKDALIFKLLVGAVHLALVFPTLRRSTAVIATSDHYLRESRFLARHEKKTGIVHPGVDLSVFSPDVEVPESLSSRFEGRRVVLFAGSLNKSQQYKGLAHLISAFAALRASHRDLTLVVAGGGDGMEMYRSLAGSAGLADDVVFTGQLEQPTLAQYYRLATVLAMPSTSRTEGFGMVYIEAGATGTPVVGCTVGGVPYAVQDNETGVLVEPGNVEALSGALARLLDDEDLARRLGENGAARASTEFTWSLAGERTDEMFRRICPR